MSQSVATQYVCVLMNKGLTACDPIPPNTRVGEALTVKLLAESTSAEKPPFTYACAF